MSLTPSQANMVTQAFRIANRAIVEDIETECPSFVEHGVRWFDTRPMLDEREHSNEVLDMATEAMSFAIASGLVVRHAAQPYLIRLCGVTWAAT